MAGVGRFRVNILRQRSSYMVVMRVLPFTLPSIESLQLPEVVGAIAESASGLVLVTGVSGSGKSSTVGAMRHHINQNQARHIVTIEDPIEILHRDLSSSVTQREVGVDTESVTVGLHSALRQDPDVIFVSDLTDPVAVDTAIKAAETGHLVIAAMPTPNVVTTIRQVLTTLPREELEIGRVRFSEALCAIVSLQLLPPAEGETRVPALEVLRATEEVRAVLKEPVDIESLVKIMQKGGDSGMTTFAKSVKALAAAGRITAETAKAVSRDPRGN
jgi:twitching motility protein PilT